MSEIAEQKERLRREILSNRKSSIAHHDDLFTENLLKVVQAVGPKRVAIYQAYRTEPQTANFINAVGLDVIVPVVIDEKNLIWRNFTTNEKTELQSGDLIFVPALAVDKSGNRLGRGKAYFDRVLANAPADLVIYAVIYEVEFLPELPSEAHDRKVQGVVSEVGIHKIN